MGYWHSGKQKEESTPSGWTGLYASPPSSTTTRASASKKRWSSRAQFTQRILSQVPKVFQIRGWINSTLSYSSLKQAVVASYQRSLTYTFRFVFTFYDQSDDTVSSPVKADGRLIYYRIGDEDGNVDETAKEELFCFKGMGLEELKEKLIEETGLSDISICSKNPLNGKLYPLRLHLPPNNTKMHVLLIPSPSKG